MEIIFMDAKMYFKAIEIDFSDFEMVLSPYR